MTELTEEKLRVKYGYEPKTSKTVSKKFRERLRCNKGTCERFVPILKWLPNYPFRKYIVGDVISGLTTAIVRIPQGLAYGMLAGLMPINGLYTGFFSPLMYSIFGTSRHISVGVFSIVSLMLGAALEKFNDATKAMSQNLIPTAHPTNVSFAESTPISNNITDEAAASTALTEEEENNLMVICSLSILIGITLISLGIARLGIIAMFLSDPVVSAFTTGAAIYVVTAQMKYVTGIRLAGKSGLFGLIRTWIELISRLNEINWPSIIVSVICLAALIPTKYVNRTYKVKMRNMPIPIELLVVIIGTLVSGFTGYGEENSYLIVGLVPRGMPSPIVPNVSLWPRLIGDAISIAIIIFAVAVSLGKIFAKKHGYAIDPNQELLALGICQITCGFLRGHSGGGALARSSVQESSGGNSQMASLISCCVLLLVLLVIGPLFENLPKACLACIILANLHGLLMQFQILPGLWRIDKFDFSVWMITFVAVMTCGIDIGLGIGVIFSLVCGVLRANAAKISFLGEISEINEYEDIKTFKAAVEISQIKIIRFSDSPTYANKSVLQQLTPSLVSSNFLRCHKNSDVEMIEFAENDVLSDKLVEKMNPRRTKIVIIDCSRWSIIDTVGLATLSTVLEDLIKDEMRVFLVSVCETVYSKLSRSGMLGEEGKPPLATVYHSVAYAVQVAKQELARDNDENEPDGNSMA